MVPTGEPMTVAAAAALDVSKVALSEIAAASTPARATGRKTAARSLSIAASPQGRRPITGIELSACPYSLNRSLGPNLALHPWSRVRKRSPHELDSGYRRLTRRQHRAPAEPRTGSRFEDYVRCERGARLRGWSRRRDPERDESTGPVVGLDLRGRVSTSRPSRPLEGEDIETTRWEDARHWMSIYADLLEFKRGILARVARDIPNLKPAAQKAAATDLQIIEAQMHGYQERLDLWYRRIWQLQGLWLDPTGRMVRHKGREVALTKREFQLLQFLLDHPHRFFTTPQILNQAWVDSALFPEEVRNYVRRLRKILVDLEIPVDLVNKPGRGYSLVFRAD